jgi:hypothetical protein
MERWNEATEPAALPAEVMLVLRAAATAGPGFDLASVSALLDQPAIEILRRLQIARDAGVPLEDLGDGTFRLPTALRAELCGQVLPSLAAAWKQRLAAARPDRADDRRPAHGPAADLLGALPDTAPPAAADAEEWAPGAAVPWPRRPAEGAPEPARPEDGEPLLAAAELDTEAARLLQAAGIAADLGLPEQALAYGRAALARLDELTPTPPRRELRLRLLIDLARFQWAAADPGAALHLEGALETAQAAAAALDARTPPALRLEVVTLLARVLYDQGDPASLQRALQILVEGARTLEDQGDAVGAARLLNDQAAVRARLGDPAGAHSLLAASRRFFAGRSDHDPVAWRELAETELLTARLPLHVPALAAEGTDALADAVAHAEAAARIYEALRLPRELARVWETLGRLELRRDRPAEADAWLQRALGAQRELGDSLGLAATAEALARLLAVEGRFEVALALLAESAEINVRKGSRRGLAHVRRALSDLAGDLAAAPHAAPALAARLRALDARLAAAMTRPR